VNESAIIQELRKTHREFQQLEKQHHQFEEQITELIRHKVLTPQEEVEKKRLQLEKLKAKDRMAQIIREHEESKDA
jgi:uncharacterized protein YdcH (DUF465 family)